MGTVDLRKIISASSVIALGLTSATLSACKDGKILAGPGYKAAMETAPSDEIPENSKPTPTPTPTPTSTGNPGGDGTFAADCMSNAAYDACIFWKSPVAQKKSGLSPSLNPTSNLDSLQIYGIKITTAGSNLENASYRIFPASGQTRITKNTAGNWKSPFSTCTSPSATACTQDANHYVGQVMAYYWLNQQLQLMESQTGKFYAKNRNIRVTTWQSDLFNAYWDGNGNIVMGDGGSSKAEFALSADIYLHEAGHANLTYAAPGTNGGLGNCASKNGCLGGIHEGQADYHAAIMFPNQAATIGSPMGESMVNSAVGFSECGIIRDIGKNGNLTAQQAYDACSTKGEVHLMGRIYASVWWVVRNRTGNDPKEVDTLFTEHLKTLQASDTFVTALSKIKTTDQALFAGKYSQAFTDEFARRGL